MAGLGRGGRSRRLILRLGTVAHTGPLAPDGWLRYPLCPVLLIWLVPATVVMVRRTGRPGLPARPLPPVQAEAGARQGGVP
jgi:hypothetical protein